MLGIKGAEIIVRKYNHPVKSASDGDYWRLLIPGTYFVTVQAPGYAPVTKEVIVPEGGTAASYNFELERSFDAGNDAGSNTKFSSEVKMGNKKPVSISLIIGLTVICTIALALAVALMVMVVKKFKRSKDNVESGYVAVQSQSD